MSNIVFFDNNRVVTSSRNIAEDFNKEHRNVTRDIEGLLKNEHTQEMFYEALYMHHQNGQEYRQYLMTRDGFTLLVMGFTGQQAMKFKLDYMNAFNEMEQQINKPQSQLEILQGTVNQMVEQEQRLSVVEKKQDSITELLSLNPTEWRKKVNAIINAIANNMGGYQAFQEVRKESYELLEERGKCQLSIRLTNKKRKMALEGSSKSRIDKTNKMDVIADDSRLTEIYLSVVKEMAIKYEIEFDAS